MPFLKIGFIGLLVHMLGRVVQDVLPVCSIRAEINVL